LFLKKYTIRVFKPWFEKMAEGNYFTLLLEIALSSSSAAAAKKSLF
jgi:hypothetical protein